MTDEGGDPPPPPLVPWVLGFLCWTALMVADVLSAEFDPEPQGYLLGLIAILYGPTVVRMFRR